MSRLAFEKLGEINGVNLQSLSVFCQPQQAEIELISTCCFKSKN